MTLYRIRDWDKHFENNRTRELKAMAWIPMPNKQDGDGYTELMDHPNGPAHFAVFVVIVEIASKCDPRGTLLRDTKQPHDARSLSRMSRVPAAIIQEALPRLVEIGWLEVVSGDGETVSDIPQEGATLGRQHPARPCLEGKGREGKGRERRRAPKPDEPTDAELVYQAYPNKQGKVHALKAIKKALEQVPFETLLDAVKEYAECRQLPGMNPQFTPYPASWFNQGRWEDDRNEWRRPDEATTLTPTQRTEQVNAEALAGFLAEETGDSLHKSDGDALLLEENDGDDEAAGTTLVRRAPGLPPPDN